MKRIFLFFALFLAAVSGFAESPAHVTTGNRRSIKVHYANSDQTREIAVVIPTRYKHQNNYFRRYVSAYIARWNSRLDDEALLLSDSKKASDVKLRRAYEAAKLEYFEDDDQIAPADKVAGEDYIGDKVRTGGAGPDAWEAVEADLKVLRAKNR
jgi:hypothetical protein